MSETLAGVLTLCNGLSPHRFGAGYVRRMDTFAHRIRRARTRAGLSQQALADAAQMTQGALAQWENGSTGRHDAERVIRAAVACRVRPEWLVLGVGPMSAQQPDVDSDTLEAALTAVLSALQDEGAELAPEKLAQAVAVVYQMLAAGESAAGTVRRLIRLAG